MKYLPVCLAMLIIGVLEAFAIYKGINGAMLSMAFLGIGGLGGYLYKQQRSK